MTEQVTYGCYHLDKESYNNIMRAPNLGVSIPRIGYNFQATNFICNDIAKQTPDCGFIDTAKLLNYETKAEAFRYILKECEHKNLIAGEIPVDIRTGQFLLLDDLITVMRLTMTNKNKPQQRFVVPLTIYSHDKEAHGVALCIDADKKSHNLNIMILEQHALKDNGALDFSKEVKMILERLQNDFRGFGMKINTFQNDKPICREKGVCGIVSTEVCRRLMSAEDPLHTAQLGVIKLNAEQVQKIHLQNFRNYQKDNSPQPPVTFKNKDDNTALK